MRIVGFPWLFRQRKSRFVSRWHQKHLFFVVFPNWHPSQFCWGKQKSVWMSQRSCDSHRYKNIRQVVVADVCSRSVRVRSNGCKFTWIQLQPSEAARAEEKQKQNLVSCLVRPSFWMKVLFSFFAVLYFLRSFWQEAVSDLCQNEAPRLQYFQICGFFALQVQLEEGCFRPQWPHEISCRYSIQRK